MKKNNKKIEEKFDAFDKVSEGIDELKKILEKAKTKYKNVDSDTKTKIVAGITGSIALLIGAIGAKKINDKKKK